MTKAEERIRDGKTDERQTVRTAKEEKIKGEKKGRKIGDEGREKR